MVRRGEVYWANLNPVKGREQAGRRPVLVVSGDAINKQPLVVSVIVGTDAGHETKDYPTNVRLPADEFGLEKDTLFLAFQIRSLDKKRLEGPVGKLSGDKMREVDAALRLSLGLS